MNYRLPPHKRRRAGVSRLELLIVVVVIAVLAALLVPAIQSARERSRLATCKMNMKLIGLGLHNYADTYNERMPPGLIANYAGIEVSVDGPTADHAGCVGWSWRVMITPFTYSHPVYNRIDFRLSIGETQRGDEQARRMNNDAVGTVRPYWNCPSDERPSHVPLDWSDGSPLFRVTNSFGGIAATSYFGNGGSFEETLTHPGVIGGDGMPPVYDGGWRSRDMANGVFVVNGSVTLTAISDDGTSNTFAVGEVSALQDTLASQHAGLYGSIGRNGALNSPVAVSAFRTGEWRLNSGKRGSKLGAARGFSSEHPGGANFLLMDGTVKLIADSIGLIPTPGLPASDPRTHAGCDWAPVSDAEVGTRCGKCGSGVYETRATEQEVFTDEMDDERRENLRRASKHFELNYGVYQRLSSRNDRRW